MTPKSDLEYFLKDVCPHCGSVLVFLEIVGGDKE